ncbi:MAG: hypothetical protein H0U49_02975 [Parachlamydiaceae bacterium]|nr:hypothetical protein [Parachlamydiaceae bacterium]
MKDNVRLNFEFPRKHYPYLKMFLAEKQVSFREYASNLLIKEMEQYEDKLLAEKVEKRLGEINPSGNLDFKEAARLAGWDDAEV